MLQVISGALGVLAIGFLALPAVLQGSAIVLLEAALGCTVLAGAAWRLSLTVQHLQARRAGLVDVSTGLYSRLGLVREGDALLARCQRADRRLALVVIEFPDLQEVQQIYGRRIGQKVVERVVSRMRRIAGVRGLAARTGRTQFTLLLPGKGRHEAYAAVQRVLGQPSRIEFDAGDSEIVLVPDMGGEAADAATRTVDEVYREVAGTIARQRSNEARRQEWLTRERMRHSRPMSLPPQTVTGARTSWPGSR
jgi:diguanylate cyclase (GGDEF)-like protein